MKRAFDNAVKILEYSYFIKKLLEFIRYKSKHNIIIDSVPLCQLLKVLGNLLLINTDNTYVNKVSNCTRGILSNHTVHMYVTIT